MQELIRVAEGVAIPLEMLATWESLAELAVKYGRVFEADLGRLGLGFNLRPIYNLNTSIGGEQAIAFGTATSSSLQFVLRPDIYHAMVGSVAH